MEQQLLYSDQQLLDQVWQDYEEKYPDQIEILATIEETDDEDEDDEITLEELDLDYDSSEDEEEEEQTDCRYCSGCYYCDINLEFDIRNEV